MLKREISVRIILLDDANNVFLLRGVLPGGGFIWLPPGGGVEVGESDVDAARRELVEETGWVVPVEQRVWRRRHLWSHGDVTHDNSATFFVGRKGGIRPQPTVDPASDEAASLEWRWWSLAELSISTQAFVPRRLSYYLSQLIDGSLPTELFEVD